MKSSIFNKYISNRAEKTGYQVKPAAFQLIKKPYVDNQHDLANNTFVFLNKVVNFEAKIEWNKDNLEKLWLYNLHYFDYLLPLTENAGEENFLIGKIIIRDWIENNPIGQGNGWEPYPLSLRTVNWIFFYQYYYREFNKDYEFERMFLNGLYQQSHYLTYFIEYHLMANHLFKNAKALYIAGMFFNNRKWFEKGTTILKSEIKEQILSDGGHFERSPMYHALILEDILDLINCSQTYGHEAIRVEVEYLQKKTEDMLKWLGQVLHSDGEIPLFGDSALNTTLNISQLKKYYFRLNNKYDAEKEIIHSVALKSSGYYTYRTKDQFVIIDGGELGPSYQPGHAHCDLFSFEYSYKGKRYIVDTGIGSYLRDEIRSKARSVKAHNTVRVNGMEQAQIWAAFRMGKRVKPIVINYNSQKETQQFHGAYENKINRSKKYRHERRIEMHKGYFLLVEDTISGHRINKIESYLHLAPDVSCTIERQILSLNYELNKIYIYLRQPYTVKTEPWFYTPEFGKMENTKLIIISPVEESILSYLIVPEKYDGMARTYIEKNW